MSFKDDTKEFMLNLLSILFTFPVSGTGTYRMVYDVKIWDIILSNSIQCPNI